MMVWAWVACRGVVGDLDADEVFACLAAADERSGAAALWPVAPDGLATLTTESGSECLIAETPGVAFDDTAICDHFAGEDPADWVAWMAVDTASVERHPLDPDDLSCTSSAAGGWSCVMETGPIDETARLDLVFADADCVDVVGGPFAYVVDGAPGSLTTRRPL
jgi:hypothetical protein